MKNLLYPSRRLAFRFRKYGEMFSTPGVLAFYRKCVAGHPSSQPSSFSFAQCEGIRIPESVKFLPV